MLGLIPPSGEISQPLYITRLVIHFMWLLADFPRAYSLEGEKQMVRLPSH